jgi:hypothetical protein
MPVTIADAPSKGPSSGTNLGNSATVKFVSFKPASSDRDLLIAVAAGPHTGLRGWTWLSQSFVAGKEAGMILCPAAKP